MKYISEVLVEQPFFRLTLLSINNYVFDFFSDAFVISQNHLKRN